MPFPSAFLLKLTCKPRSDDIVIAYKCWNQQLQRQNGWHPNEKCLKSKWKQNGPWELLIKPWPCDSKWQKQRLFHSHSAFHLWQFSDLLQQQPLEESLFCYLMKMKLVCPLEIRQWSQTCTSSPDQDWYRGNIEDIIKEFMRDKWTDKRCVDWKPYLLRSWASCKFWNWKPRRSLYLPFNEKKL